MFDKRRFIAFLALLCAACATPQAWAQAEGFPKRPVKITTFFPVGVAPEVAVRLIADRLSQIWGQPVIVDNKPGAHGYVAADAVKKAAPDGHDLLQVDNFLLTLQPHIFKKAPVDVGREFDPVAALTRNDFLIAVSAASPYKTLGDLVAAARADAKAVTYGSLAVGSPGHLSAAALEATESVTMTHVPFKEWSQLMTNVINQNVSWVFASSGNLLPQQKAGRMRILAVSSARRLDALPEVPTVTEALRKPYEINGWLSLLAPKGVPASVADKIRRDVNTALNDQDIRRKLADLGYEPYTLTPDQFAAAVKVESDKYAQLVKTIHLTSE